MEDEKFHFRHIMPYEFCKELWQNIKLYLECASAPWTVEKCFNWFCLGHFNLNDQPCFRRPSNVNENSLLVIVENKPKISTEETVMT